MGLKLVRIGGGKPRPYYTRAWQAASFVYSGDPGGRPALKSRLWRYTPY